MTGSKTSGSGEGGAGRAALGTRPAAKAAPGIASGAASGAAGAMPATTHPSGAANPATGATPAGEQTTAGQRVAADATRHSAAGTAARADDGRADGAGADADRVETGHVKIGEAADIGRTGPVTAPLAEANPFAAPLAEAPLAGANPAEANPAKATLTQATLAAINPAPVSPAGARSTASHPSGATAPADGKAAVDTGAAPDAAGPGIDAHTHAGHLGAVYAARTPDEIAARYDRWAGSYDADMAASGYRHPSIAVALLARHLPPTAAPVLDAGAGTGLIGEWLGLLGYPHAEALDLSEGMLAVARAKGVYAALHRLALGGPLPFADGHFAAVISSGVFTTGHVGAEALPELLRITRPGGVLVLTVKETLWDAGFGADVAALAGVRLIARTPPYVSMPGEPGTIPGFAIVLRKD